MSQENVEVVESMGEAWNAGDMHALRELYDPDVIMRAAEGWPEPGPYVGREAVTRQWEEQREAFDADAIEPISDFIEAADRVVVRVIWHGAGHGPEANLELTAVFTVRPGPLALYGVPAARSFTPPIRYTPEGPCAILPPIRVVDATGSGRGWQHYTNRRRFQPGACSIDLWPDLSEFTDDEKFATPFRHARSSCVSVSPIAACGTLLS